jgi:hypothetical protein
VVTVNQFDIVKNSNAAASKIFPYLCILQHDFLFRLDTVLVAPLRPSANVVPIKTNLNITIVVQSKPHVLLVEFMSPELRRTIKSVVGSASAHRYEIKRAIDAIFDGI